MNQRQAVLEIQTPGSSWKKRICDLLLELNIIPEGFTGKAVISFKDGGINYIEKSETFK